jgi:diguanylate cyclase (GGDEF)-like protein
VHHELAECLRVALATLSATAEPDQVLLRLVDLAIDLLTADEGWLILPDGQTQATVYGRSVDTHPDDVEPAVCVTDEDFAERLALTCAGPITGPIADVPLELADLTEGAACWLALPLTTRTEHLGVLLLTRSGPDPFSATDLVLADILVRHAMAAHDGATLVARVARLAIVDELTGLPNRPHFHTLAQRQFAAAGRAGTPVAAMMIDIDHIKVVNYTLDHPTGDDVIHAVATRLAAATRQTDTLGRVEGQKFAVLLTPGEGTPIAAERFRTAVAGTPVQTRSGPLQVTISIGLALQVEAGQSMAELLDVADTALIQAKDAGRNRTHIA